MSRPVKWARDLHPIHERAVRSRTETWSRQDVEHLFGVGRATAQTLMKVVGEVQALAGAHFVERQPLLAFLEEMIAATSIEEALRARLLKAEPPPRPKSLRISLPADLRNARMPDLPLNITLEPGRLEVRADTAVAMLESLMALAMVMQNDLDRFQEAIEPRSIAQSDDALAALLQRMRVLIAYSTTSSSFVLHSRTPMLGFSCGRLLSRSRASR